MPVTYYSAKTSNCHHRFKENIRKYLGYKRIWKPSQKNGYLRPGEERKRDTKERHLAKNGILYYNEHHSGNEGNRYFNC